MTKKNDDLLVKPIAKTLSSIASYSGTIYIIILTLSICYNVGYFKQINPQIIDLMELSDYINDTIHNVWFFLLGAFIFFVGNLRLLPINIKQDFNKILIFGICAFVLTLYYLFKGIYTSKLWPIIKKAYLTLDGISFSMIIVLLIIMIVGTFFVYGVITTRAGSDQEKNVVSTGITPILILMILVLVPYIGGMAQGYIENKFLVKEDFELIHSVDVHLISGNKILKDVFLIKKINKGIVLRQFNDESDSICFINWGAIESITYTRVEKPLSIF